VCGGKGGPSSVNNIKIISETFKKLSFLDKTILNIFTSSNNLTPFSQCSQPSENEIIPIKIHKSKLGVTPWP
jgi:hypothetical protein